MREHELRMFLERTIYALTNDVTPLYTFSLVSEARDMLTALESNRKCILCDEQLPSGYVGEVCADCRDRIIR